MLLNKYTKAAVLVEVTAALAVLADIGEISKDDGLVLCYCCLSLFKFNMFKVCGICRPVQDTNIMVSSLISTGNLVRLLHFLRFR